MSRYIDADKLSEMIEARGKMLVEGKEAFYYIANWLNKLPPADVAEVKHAHWTDAVSGCWHCSECLHPILLNGGEEYVFSNHCPNCGARMDGERKDEE